MFAILIDPATQTVSAVDYSGDFHQIYEHIQASTFDIVRADRVGYHFIDLYVDDEGLLAEPPKPLFEFAGYQQPLAGRTLVLGGNPEGDSMACPVSVASIQSKVTFRPDLRFKDFTDTTHQVIHPILGKATMIKRVANFVPTGAGGSAPGKASGQD